MKLPEINYSRGVPAAQLTEPGQEVSASRQRHALLTQALRGADEVTQAHRQYELTKAFSEYSDEMSAFRREAAKERVVGREKIMAWGLDDVIDVDSKESFFRAEWYPIALERQMEKARAKYGDRLGSSIDRNTFNMEVEKGNNAMLEREIALATEESWREQEAMVRADIDSYLNAGQWDSAAKAVEAASFLQPSEKQALYSNIALAKDANTVRDETHALIERNDIGGLQEWAKYLRSDEAAVRYELTPEDLDRAAGSVDRAIEGLQAEAKMGMEQSKGFVRASVMADLHRAANGKALTWAMIDQAMQQGEAMGDATLVNGVNRMWENYTASGGQSPYPKNSDPKARWGIVQAMMSDDPGSALKAYESAVAGNQLDAGDVSGFQDKLSKMNSDPSYQNDIIPTSAILKNAYVSLDLDPNSKDGDEIAKLSAFQRAFAAETLRRQASEKRKLTTDEEQQVADELVRKIKYEPSGLFDKVWTGVFGVPNPKSVYETILDDMGDEEAYRVKMSEITDAMRRHGIPITAENIRIQYEKMR